MESRINDCERNKTGINITDSTSDNRNCKPSSVEKIHQRFFLSRKNPFQWSRRLKTNRESKVSIKSDTVSRKVSASNDSCKSMTEIKDKNTSLIINEDSEKGRNVASNAYRVLRKQSFKKFISRIAQQVTSINNGGNKHSSVPATVSDRVPPIGGYQWPPDQTPGVTGLKNHGNTCFMNAVLQCLSHTDILAEYFVLDQYKADLKRNKLNSRKFGTKGELTEELANVLKALWTCKNENDHSTSFKAVVDRYGSQFRSSTQHDAQEFLFWLLDKVHEDLNTATKKRYKTIKNNYGRPDEVIAAETLANHIRCNNSFVQAVFQAQFRSSLTCPRCHKQSNTFDPFHCISVQLPQFSQQVIFVTVLYATQHPRQVKLALAVPVGSSIIALREQLYADTGISIKKMVLVDINETGFSRVFYDSQPISSLEGVSSIYCVEVPENNENLTSSSNLMLLIANVKKHEDGSISRFGTPFCVQVNRDCSYTQLQKRLLKEMSNVMKPEVFTYATPPNEMFEIRLQDPSADPDTYIDAFEHPLFTEVVDVALSVLSTDAGPPHIKLLLEWKEPEKYFHDINDPIVEHESVSRLKEKTIDQSSLTLEQCLDHYTKAETLSAEDAWKCPNCQQYLPVVKTLGLWSLPDILVIHFKRFKQQSERALNAAKLTTLVTFPLNAFDMTPHLARGSASSNNSLSCDENCTSHGGSPWRKTKDHFRGIKDKEKELKDNRYDLYAVCYHQGDTLETGHYTAACKNPYDHQWYKFDDQRVTHVPAEKVQEEIINNEAYILFYQRRKIDNSECSGTSSSSGDHWVSKIVPPTTLSNCVESVNSIGKCDVQKKEIAEKSEKESEKINIKISENFNDAENEEKENSLIENKDDNKDSNINSKVSELVKTNKIKEVIKNTSKSLLSFELEQAKENEKKSENSENPQEHPQKKDEFIKSGFDNQKTLSIWNEIQNEDETIKQLESLHHSFSTSSSYKIQECELTSMLRSSTGSSCSKDTLLFIDQQNHDLMEDPSFLSRRSLWMSPVTPHKLITVSPKS